MGSEALGLEYVLVGNPGRLADRINLAFLDNISISVFPDFTDSVVFIRARRHQLCVASLGATVADAKIQDAINIIEKAAKRKHARKKDRKHKRKSKDRRIKTKSDRKASKRDRNDKRKRHSDSPVTSVTTS